MLQRIASALGLAAEPTTAPHIVVNETRQVRLNARPRRCEQTYGAPYFAATCSDGTVAIMLDAETHREFGALKPGAELTIIGRWVDTVVPRHHCDRVFHIDALAS